jgi:pimeloyl-ACP methyl ester carboxylesterase
VDFRAGYEALLARWPVEVERLDVRTRHGTTRVNACGPPDGMPLVLLSGYGTTSAIWYANVGALSRQHRVYALDRLGDRGLSVYDGQPITDRAGLMSYLDDCLDELGAGRVDLCGHSYGGWTALRYAQHAPDRVRRLVLLDPTQCFSGLRWDYLLHALPMLVRPGPRSRRRMLRWETAGEIDPDVLEFLCAPATTSSPPGAKFVVSKRPTETELRAVRTPTLVLLAGRGRQHHNEKVAAIARERLPDVEVRELPAASHHTIPFAGADDLNRQLGKFL